MNWYQLDPPPEFQWVGIGVTCAGTVAGLAGLGWAIAESIRARRAAQNAKTTAEAAEAAANRARSAAESLGAVYELQAVQDDLADLSALCSTEPADFAAIARSAARLGPRLGVAAASLDGRLRDNVSQASLDLLEIPPETANPQTKSETKLHRISSKITGVQGTLTVAQQALRRTPNLRPNDAARPNSAAASSPTPDGQNGGRADPVV